ncbi:DNA (Cytosine-5)-methyltransferase DRM1/2 isoform 2 [Hibiscus syriacus]|uniref:DNA (Cytosine-5)-methyltransferase DRM1/2 isoform 2 n=1 Tax=Hibiscus syriacus TaxID=106335 RepID=A0A6A3D0P9_HIBSY|nr:DNA (Cytosine-5)-methyltransferase DRM1/2 isoform 2 [Hibiscus syriacus]
MQHVDSDNYSSDYEAIFQNDFIDIDSSSDTEEILNSDSYEENKLLYLTKMGYSDAEASIAMERCDPDSSIAELPDFICAAQMTKAADVLLTVEDRKSLCNDHNYKKMRNLGYDFWKRKKQGKLEKKLLNENDYAIHLPNPMFSFGFPTEPDQITQRTLPEDSIGPPYFYYENVALAPVGSAKLTAMICKALEAYDDESPLSVQKYVLDECRKWNLVWVGRNKVVPLEPDEVEMLLEVVFYCLGIPLKTDVQELNDDRLEQLMSIFVEFDLVVGGIPYAFNLALFALDLLCWGFSHKIHSSPVFLALLVEYESLN